MQAQKTLTYLPSIKPYVSSQHGALITMISVNLLGVIHSDKIHIYQIFALFFSLSAFHAAEIFLLPRHQKLKLRNAFYVYSSLAIFCGLYVFANQPQFPVLISGLMILSFLFFLARSISDSKTFFHLVSFALLIWISLFSLDTHSSKVLLNMFIQLFAYFTFTVAFIHWRLGKIPFQYLQIIFLSELALCGILYQWKGISALAIVLITKSLMIQLTNKYWQKAPLKVIGYAETISLTVYIIIMTFI